jgi:hypothetical protein
MNLDINHGISLINKAVEERDKEKVWQQWLVLYPNMSEENFISFDDYYNSMKVTNISITKSKEDIISEAEEIEKKLLGRGE